MSSPDGRLFEDLRPDPNEERFTELWAGKHVRIERIVSCGHTSPPDFWYDQAWDEWVLVLTGVGVVAFDDGSSVRLEAGDYLHIPAHQRHRVTYTTPGEATVWLAVHVSDGGEPGGSDSPQVLP